MVKEGGSNKEKGGARKGEGSGRGGGEIHSRRQQQWSYITHTVLVLDVLAPSSALTMSWSRSRKRMWWTLQESSTR